MFLSVVVGSFQCEVGFVAMMKKTELVEFKRLLQILRARLRGDVEQLTVEALDRNATSGDSRSPTHIAELGTDAYEQDFSLRFVENEQETLKEIKAALSRIEDGTYGTCELCREEGKPPSRSRILKSRLRAIPFARNCIECERKRENMSP